jgi:membrane protease subunit (stomatin/prohibitin family)
VRLFDVIDNQTHLANGGAGTAEVIAWKFIGEDFYDKSQLIVAENEEAVFFRDGLALGVYGGGRYTLDTQNHPFLTPLRSRLSDGKNAFQCKVYFVNKAHNLEMKWGTDSPIQVRDPVLGIATGVQARGSYSFVVDDSKRFIMKMVANGVQEFSREEVRESFVSAFSQRIKDTIADYLMSSGQEILMVANRKDELAAAIQPKMTATLDDYGLRPVNFYVASIDIPDSEQRDKLEKAFGDRSVMGILGENWGRQQSAEILMDLANNSGAGGVAAAGAGLGLGMAAGGVFNDMSKQLLATPSAPAASVAASVMPTTAASSLMPASAADAAAPSGATLACPSCGAANGVTAKFCAECGTGLRATCPSCGTGLAPGSKFCPECGRQIGGAS